MARIRPRACPAVRSTIGLAFGLLLTACTLSFDAPSDGGRRDARASDGRVGDAINLDAPPTPIDGQTPDATEGGPVPDAQPDAPPLDSGPDATPSCDPSRCPRVACRTAICQADGTCGSTPSPAGTSCDDGDPCTTGDSCDSTGGCRATSGCTEDSNPCTNVVCGPSGCETQPVDDGSGCGSGECCDGDCTSVVSDPGNCGACGASCSSGLCVDGSCVSCRFDSDCGSATIDGCVSSARCDAGRCAYTVRPTHCFIEGSCYATGDAAPGNPCRICMGGSTSWTDRATCDDGNYCSVGDVCVITGSSGRCDPGPARGCDDGNSCTDDSCNEAADRCDHIRRMNGSPCDDGDRCTVADACDEGVCSARPACPMPGPCERSLCDAATGACSIEYLPPGMACTDGDPCTTGDRCTTTTMMTTVCTPTGPTCSSADPCVLSSCDGMTGACSSPPADFGTPCTDVFGCSSICDGGGFCQIACPPGD